ncbi:hypothetical protein [Nitratifractor sp.]
MRKLFVSIVLLLSVWGGAAVADPPDDAIKVIKHLEFMGYDAKADAKHIIAKHPKELNIFIKKYNGGMLVTAYFGSNDYGKKHQMDLIKVVNDLNRAAVAARFYIDKDGDLVIEGYYPGSYERKRFGIFMEAFNHALENINEHKSKLLKYLE